MSGAIDSAPPVSIARRAAARVIDFALLGAVAAFAGSMLGFGFAWLVATAGATYAYFVLADALAGSTLGKALLGLRIVGTAESRPTIAQSAKREEFVLLGAVPFVGPPLALVAWITIWRTGWHDRWAGGTRVVR